MCVCVWSGLCPTSDCPTWDSPDPTEPARVPLARALSRWWCCCGRHARARAPPRACALAGCPGAWARSPDAAAGGAGSARDAVRGASPAGCPTCEGREADSAAGEGGGAARSAAACALPLPQRPRLWLRRSRAVSVLQLHEGVVVGRKTCVKALLRARLSPESRLWSLAEVLQLALAHDGKNCS